jgi:FtsZ-binding cell division protein ZapB
MEWREFNRATLEVASNTDLSGGTTAEEANRGMRIGRWRSLRDIAGSTVLGSLMAAGLLIEFTPKPAWAEENERGIRKEIEALEAKVSSLEQSVSALQSQIGNLETSNTTLQDEVSWLQTQLAAVQSNRALLLGPFVTVDPNPEIGVIGPNIIFSGANIHIVSGSGATNDKGQPTGLGNLIIGYDEDPKDYFTGAPGGGIPLSPGDRGGSHNLVIGIANRFTRAAFGGLVTGKLNTISNGGTTVSGGELNIASGFGASVSGGTRNTASGFESSVSGGGANIASGQNSSVSGGGFGGIADGYLASVSGGGQNAARGYLSSVIGGFGNTANGQYAVVIGGQNVINNNSNSIAPGAPLNFP